VSLGPLSPEERVLPLAWFFFRELGDIRRNRLVNSLVLDNLLSNCKSWADVIDLVAVQPLFKRSRYKGCSSIANNLFWKSKNIAQFVE